MTATPPTDAALVEEIARVAQSASVGKPFRWENVATALLPLIARERADEREKAAKVAAAERAAWPNRGHGSDCARLAARSIETAIRSQKPNNG